MAHQDKKDSIANRKHLNGNNADNFPIVGVGASAGGLEALEQFFGNMPDTSGIAFVVIQHLDPNHAGVLPELLQRITSLKVFQASDQLKVKPDCVYVIPPNKSISILNGTLNVFDRIESHGLSLPIDIFFHSLADDRGERSIGIILSGMGSDGSLGLKAIKEKGGVVLVQDPSSAKFDTMPVSAIETVSADIVASAGELAGKLINFLKYSPPLKTGTYLESKNQSNIDKIIIILRAQTGHDFSLYRKNTLFRRIERRKGIHQIDKIQDYVRFLQENPWEVELLFKELLIGVTSFFRDPNVWETLRDKVLPVLMDKLPDKYMMRAWVPACSTGEEAYSLAIIFREALEKVKKPNNLSLKIFATDLDIDAIEKARKGVFPKNIEADISPERLKRFFTVSNENYRINTSIRELVVFASQNVIKDPPFTKLDLISCRNLLIYIEPEMQSKLIALFCYSLNPGGIMLLGTSENPGSDAEGFTAVDSKLKIFKRSDSFQTHEFDLPGSIHENRMNISEKKLAPKIVENIQTLTDQIMLQHFAPASVLVNEKGDIIYITGRTGKYLEPVAGKANWNIHAMARDGLSNELPRVFHKALQTYDPVTVRNIKMAGNQFISITVQHLENPESIRGLVLLVFRDEIPPQEDQYFKKTKSGKVISTKHQKEMENELQQARQELQTTREEMQTSQEELKSINEELQSTNEELQSTNEELTTSKEEMQSLNEELQTVNVELQNRVGDLVQINDDMKNLLNSTEIATLFLDRDLNIRRYTDTMTKIFKLRNSDIGRPFTELATDLKYPEIADHSRQVIKTLLYVQTEIQTVDNRWFNVRIMPYRTNEDRIDGLVMTFTEVTVAKKLELELKRINEELKKTSKIQ